MVARHRNWGLVSSRDGDARRLRFSPVFDTARGLFWNLSDESLLRKIADVGRETLIAGYAERSRPLISCAHGHTINHFGLIEYLLGELGSEFQGTVRRVIDAYSPRRARALLLQRFGRILSHFRVSLILDLLAYRHKKLKAVCDRTK